MAEEHATVDAAAATVTATENEAPAVETTPKANAEGAVNAADDNAADNADNDTDPLSRKVTLADLCARAAAQYAHRAYDVAADTYAQAAQLQAELRDELDPENAEILFLYGRALFKVGQAKSSILGGTGKLTGDEEGGDVEKKVREALGMGQAEDGKGKGLVQLDDGMDEDEEGEEEEEGEDGGDEEGEGGEEDEEDDDLESAFQALDLAGVLFKRKLDSLEGEDKKEAEEDKEEVKEDNKEDEDSGKDQIERHVKERLGDTHDILAEIHLENERFPHAVDDIRRSLEYKLALYAPDDSVIAEAQFKLSLALEFASLAPAEGDEGSSDKDTDKPAYNKALRDEAVVALEAAIASSRLKLKAMEVELATSAAPDENETTRAQIADVREMISDMEERLVELRKPPQPVDLAENLLGDAVAGFAKALGGKSSDEQAALLQEAIKGANDLTGLVRKKKVDEEEEEEKVEEDKEEEKLEVPNAGAKRKASHDDGPGEEAEEGTESKKARVEDA